MAKNGKISWSGKSSHIGIKFFWVADRLKQGKNIVKHFPTKTNVGRFIYQASTR